LKASKLLLKVTLFIGSELLVAVNPLKPAKGLAGAVVEVRGGRVVEGFSCTFANGFFAIAPSLILVTVCRAIGAAVGCTWDAAGLRCIHENYIQAMNHNASIFEPIDFNDLPRCKHSG